MPCVVADTSPIFYLAQLRHLRLLRELYDTVHVPGEVWAELQAGGRVDATLVPMLTTAQNEGWMICHDVPTPVEPAALLELDRGEAEAITLAQSLRADLLVIDELKCRAVATNLGLPIIGTLGVLASAKREGLISSLRTEFRRLRHETGFRFSLHLERELLSAAGEDTAS